MGGGGDYWWALAHTGQALLTEYALATRGTVKDIYLVHGEAVVAGANGEAAGEWDVECAFAGAEEFSGKLGRDGQ